MKTFKIEANKIILVLTLVGLLILLIFPSNVSANHFRYGTMSWSIDNSTSDNTTIRLKMENGWTANHGSFRESSDYDAVWVSGFVGSVKNNYIEIFWGDGSNSNDVDLKITSRESSSGTGTRCAAADNQSILRCIDSTISEMGDYTSSTWKTGSTYTYDNGTYVIQWNDGDRTPVSNNGSNGVKWRNETMVRVGGDYSGNVSPVSAVPPVVQVQDNRSFTYQVSATDANNDNLTYRWGYIREFFTQNGSGDDTVFTKPTGMTLSSSGLIEWDIRDNVTCTGCSTNNDAVDNGTNRLWVAVIMIEDRLDNGTAKSYIPVDFFFQVTSADNDPPVISGLPNTSQTVSVGSTKIFSFTSTDDSGVAPTVSVLNPPTDNSTIWSTNSTTSGGTTTFTITFAPDSAMGDLSYVINIRSTDAIGMTKDQSLSLLTSSVANDAPTAPILISPADGDNVTSPVTFTFAGSTDPDGDTLSYALYICTRQDFAGCDGKSVTAGGNFVPPFNQNFHDNLMPWPSQLHAATIIPQISHDNTMLPKWFFMLVILGLLCGIITLSVKDITLRRIVFMLFLIIIGTTVSCSTSTSSDESSDNSSTLKVDNTTVFLVATTDNQSLASIYDNITVTFSKAMDPTYITTNTSDSYCSGTIMVSKSSDNFSTGTCVKMSSAPASSNANKTFTLDPYDNLTRLSTYLTRVTVGVRDALGNAIMSSQYETTSGFSTDNISTARSTVTSSGYYLSGASITTYSPGTYYWKVVASDPIGASAQSETWSFIVQ